MPSSQQPSSYHPAAAKINLTLKITGKREDGYHLMDSLVVFAGLHDLIDIQFSTQDHLVITGPYANELQGVPKDKNIIFIAVERFRAATGWRQHVHISLEKHIPVAAGIGGGSSDAATVLMVLNDMCPSPMTFDDLCHLGVTIGADVPVCLHRHAYGHHLWRMRGIGEELSPVQHDPSSNYGLVLMNPGISVPTSSIFKAMPHDDIIDNGFGQGRSLSAPLSHDDIMAWLDDGNSLTAPAAMLHHDIHHAIMKMQGFQQHSGFLTAGMSGSGATVFALFENVNAAVSAASLLSDNSYWLWAGGVFKPDRLRHGGDGG